MTLQRNAANATCKATETVVVERVRLRGRALYSSAPRPVPAIKTSQGTPLILNNACVLLKQIEIVPASLKRDFRQLSIDAPAVAGGTSLVLLATGKSIDSRP